MIDVSFFLKPIGIAKFYSITTVKRKQVNSNFTNNSFSPDNNVYEFGLIIFNESRLSKHEPMDVKTSFINDEQ